MKRNAYHNRIALSYLTATAALLALAFMLIYLVVRMTVYANLDNTLHTVAKKHAWEVQVKNGKVSFINKIEWEEREHREVEVNPVFIELFDAHGQTMDKSPNLKVDSLGFHPHILPGEHFDTFLRNKPIRMLKIPVVRGEAVVGYISTAIPIDGYLLVLKTLRNILFLTFLFALLVLFFTARYLASKSIRPVKVIIEKARHINSDNLADRIPVPATRDELHELAVAINALLERIDESLQREKQFTADAAHQLKTPLAVLKGSLGVLVRKPRSNSDYVAGIHESLAEIDRLNHIVDKLLVMARVDSNAAEMRVSSFSAVEAIDIVIQRAARKIENKNISLAFEPQQDVTVITDPFIFDLILENLLSNAIKYSNRGSQIEIVCNDTDEAVVLQLHDKGIGIAADELNKIFLPFYRGSSEAIHREKGSGIGLSIVAKACKIAGIKLSVQSRINEGTHVQLEFPKQKS